MLEFYLICQQGCRGLLVGLVLVFSTVLRAEPVPVTTQPLATLVKQQHYHVPATVEALSQPSLAAEISGRILHLPVRVGDRVKQGQELARLDCRAYQQQAKIATAALRRAQTQQNFAQAQLKRAQNLKDKRSISDELFEQRRTELAIARAETQTQSAQQALAQLKVKHCCILAPFDAVVQARLASEGDLATPGTPLLKLVQLSQAEISAMLRGVQASSLQAAAPYFRYQGQDYPVALRTLLPLWDTATRTQEARLIFTAATAPIGAAGRLHWQGQESLLPAELVLRRGEGLGVFVARNDQAIFVPLRNANEGQPAATSLAPGEKIIIEGRHNVQNGNAILVQDSGSGE